MEMGAEGAGLKQPFSGRVSIWIIKYGAVRNSGERPRGRLCGGKKPCFVVFSHQPRGLRSSRDVLR